MYSTNSNSEVVVNHIKKRKLDLIKVFGSKCCICGFNAYSAALEFHHVNPKQKSFGITDSKSVTKALNKQLEEMKKCILVCANCHRGIHSGYLEVPSNYQSFYNEEIAQQLLQELDEIKNGKKHYCKRCGKLLKSTKAIYCVDCGHIIQQKCERPSRQQLKSLIREKPFTQIATQYNVTDNAIRKWCDSYNLPRKKGIINNFTDQEWEKI